MGLVTTKDMFEKAQEGHYAIGAFNVNNMEIVQGIVAGAKEESSPIILQVSGSARKYAGHMYLLKLAQISAFETGLPIALHLDHGADFEICRACIDGGFTSVMIDGSKYNFEDNVALTKKVVDYAHERGVVVEAEIGKLAGVEDEVSVESNEALYTEPEEALKFIELTNCDSLAIAIGTSHGAYKFKGEPKLRFDILQEIQRVKPNYPIVLHGASSVMPEYVEMCNKYGGNIPGAKGVPEELLKKAGEEGVAKINMDTDIRLTMTAVIRKFFAENPEVFDPRQYLSPARDAIKELVKHKIKNVLNSSNRV